MWGFSIILSILVSCLSGAQTWASSANYFVSGTNSLRGAYKGWLTVNDNGQVQRVVQYLTYEFNNHKVQEAWLGQEDAQGDFIFTTSQAHFVFQANEVLVPASEAFLNKSVVITAKGTANFTNADHTVSTESLVQSTAPLSPLYLIDVNTSLRDVFSQTPAAVKSAISIAKIRFKWASDPLVKELTSRSHCVEQRFSGPRAQSVEDFTDQNFYRGNPQILRAYNSPANPLALAEGSYRNAAFAKNFSEKVELADQAMDSQFINSWGMNSYSLLLPDGSTKFYPDHDSALWTGEYLAFLANVYNQTKNPNFLERIKKTANGLMLLVELFEGTQEFGRTVEDYEPGEPLSAEWQVFSVEGKTAKVKKGGNNDMFKGVLLGLIAASLSVPEKDLAFQQRLQKVTQLILELKIQKKSNTTKLLSYGLAAIVFKSTDYKTKFVKSFENLTTELYNIYDGVFYWNGTSDYSGVNLGVVGLYTSFLIAHKLDTPKVIESIKTQVLKKETTFAELHHFEILLLLKKISNGKLELPEQTSLNATLQTIPYPRPELTVSYDHSWEDNFCLSPIPTMFWKAFNTKQETASDHVGSLTNYPLYASAGIDSNYIFKDAYFRFKGSANRNVRSSPIDLLFAWTLYDAN